MIDQSQFREALQRHQTDLQGISRGVENLITNHANTRGQPSPAQSREMGFQLHALKKSLEDLSESLTASQKLEALPVTLPKGEPITPADKLKDTAADTSVAVMHPPVPVTLITIKDPSGDVLAAPDGKALYTHGPKPDFNKRWPYIVPVAPVGFAGLGITTSGNNKQTASYEGRALFTFADDVPGSVSGEDASWKAVRNP